MHRRFVRGMVVAATTGIGAGLLAPVAAYANVGCGQTITTSLTLTHDLVCPGDGIIIGASNVTLDLGGHTLTGPPPVQGSGRQGVTVTSDRRNVSITNGAIRGFDFGVNMHNRANARVTSLRIDGSFHGVNTQTDSSGSSILANTFSNTTHNSIQLGGNNHTVEANTFIDAGSSAMLVSGNRNVVRGNHIVGAAAVGVATLAFPSNEGPFADNQISRNVIVDSGRLLNSPGISISSGSRTVVDGNTVTGGGTTPGISVNDSAGTVVSSNTSDSNGTGVYVWGNAIGTAVLGNRVTRNAFSGITVQSPSTATLVSGNVSYGNGGDGIDASSPSTTITSNTAVANGAWGIFAVAGVVDGGGNRAVGNGRPAQCTPNILCS